MSALQKSVFSLFAILVVFQANHIMANQSKSVMYPTPSGSQIVNGKNAIFFASKDKYIGKKLNQAFNSPHFENEIKQIFHDSKNTFKVNDTINFILTLATTPQDNYVFFTTVRDQNGQVIMKSKGKVTSLPGQIKPRIDMISIPFDSKVKPKPGVYSANTILVNNDVLSDNIQYIFSLS